MATSWPSMRLIPLQFSPYGSVGFRTLRPRAHHRANFGHFRQNSYRGVGSDRALMFAREESLVSISQACILGERHRDFFDAVRAAALTKEGSIKRPSAPEHVEDPVVGVPGSEFRHDLSFLPPGQVGR
jgi:hypothetical protein